MTNSNGNSNRNALILIHGIGDHRARSTLDEFLKGSMPGDEPDAMGIGLKDIDQSFELNMCDAAADGTAPAPTPSFEYFAKTLDHGSEKTVIGELYWGDLSPIRTGLIATFRNFFELVRDTPAIVYATLASRREDSNILSRFFLGSLNGIMALSFWIIYYPIVWISLAYLIHIANLALISNIPLLGGKKISPTAPITWIFDILSVIYALLLVYGCYRITSLWRRMAPGNKNRFRIRYLAILAGGTAVCLILPVVNSMVHKLNNQPLTVDDFRTLLDWALTIAWAGALSGPIIFLAFLPVLLLAYPQRRNGILVGFAASVFTVLFWELFFNTTGLWMIHALFEKTELKEMRNSILESMPLVGLLWIGLLIGLISILQAMLRHILKSRKSLKADLLLDNYPRQIITPLLAVIAILFLLFLLFTVYDCTWATSIDACSIADNSSAFIYDYSGRLLIVGAFMISVFPIIFEVIGDIVAYFRTNTHHREPWPWNAFLSAYHFDGDEGRALQPELRSRLANICADMQARYGPFQTVTIAAHSLGTMVVHDGVTVGTLSSSPDYKLNCVLMATPMSNIFTHYFPHLYGEGKQAPIPDEIRALNIYRTNDYVGTRLAPEFAIQEQVPLLPLGHFGYFADTEVCRKIWTLHIGTE